MEPLYTVGEKAELTWLVARMSKRGLAARNSPTGDVHQGDLQRKLERVKEGAARRTDRDARVALGAVERAEEDVAVAKNAERRARGDEKPAAREAHRKAKQHLADAKRAARNYL